jgi:hypothetical protein
MFDSDLDFLSYADLRRRALRHLVGGQTFLMHLALFVSTVTLQFFSVFSRGYTEGEFIPPYFIHPSVGKTYMVWAVVLGVHAVWTFWRSGIQFQRRSRAVETAIDERANTLPIDDERDRLHLQLLLDEDIRQRATLLIPPITFAVISAFVWVWWATTGASTSFTWQITPFAVIPFILWMMVLVVRRQASGQPSLRTSIEKRKHVEAVPRLELVEDGELIEFPTDKKAKRHFL